MPLHWIHLAGMLLILVLELLTILHILLTMRDDPERASLWLILVILLPLLGILLYLIAGISRLNTFGKRIPLPSTVSFRSGPLPNIIP